MVIAGALRPPRTRDQSPDHPSSALVPGWASSQLQYGAIRNSMGVTIIPPAGARGVGGGGAHGCVSGLLLAAAAAGLLNPAGPPSDARHRPQEVAGTRTNSLASAG